MLLEHKLHATKLQSEVSVLTQEKVRIEEHIESLLDEISEFEEGVKTLEKEMHQLSKIQTEAAGVLDEEAKIELRDQKVSGALRCSCVPSSLSDTLFCVGPPRLRVQHHAQQHRGQEGEPE
jgi:hypothetical protein